MLVDSHCHLDNPKFDEDRDAVVGRALEAGVETMVSIGTGDGPPDLEVAVRLAEKYPSVLATVGVHPHDAKLAVDDTCKRLEQLLKHPRVIALGEIGLDYHYDHSPRDVQKAIFIDQLAVARDAGVPIIIHTRSAWDDTFEILEKYWKPSGLPGIMHCFSGGPMEAQRSLEMGFYISFAGVVTFPKSLEIQEAARMVPAERLLVETDAPFLAPVPYRGKRNEPAWVVKTMEYVAGLRNLPSFELASSTSENWKQLFRTKLTPTPSINY
jgi:TatD DNase family protein